jgi:N6-L-threonylcarbamoyladenine synthase
VLLSISQFPNYTFPNYLRFLPTILAIESSCDETAAAICRDGKILSNIVANQTIHQQWGGVVPELASRAHLQNIIPVVEAAVSTANCKLSTVQAIAFTQSPGLIGSLLVGAQFAKSLALALSVPLIAVHHMQAHVLANLIPSSVGESTTPDFPFLCLTISGGHTQIVLCESPPQLHLLGETIDDAAGEAFDKSAKLLGLPYPGGPLIDQHAKQGKGKRFQFAEPNVPGLDFSFSGLKTSILYFLQDQLKKDPQFIEKNLDDLCASIQQTIINILLKKLKRAAVETGIRNICLAGGVSANSGLRKEFQELGKQQHWKTFIPPLEYCTDNAAMIAITGYYKYLEKDFAEFTISPSAKAEF